MYWFVPSLQRTLPSDKTNWNLWVTLLGCISFGHPSRLTHGQRKSDSRVMLIQIENPKPMKKVVFSLFAALILFASASTVDAQTVPATWKKFDLAKYGMGFSIAAPASATFDWDGDSEELYINAEDDRFRIMISIMDETPAELIAESKEEVEEGGDVEFVAYVKNEKNGFLAKEEVEGAEDHEVYYAFSKGGKNFYIQTNPMTNGELYTEQDGLNIFSACKGAAGL